MKHDVYIKDRADKAASGNKISCQRSSERGLTLLEVVIALAIFSVGIMAVASLQVSSTNGDTRARLATEGAIAAHDQAEKLLSMNYDPLNPTEEFLDDSVSGYQNYPTDRATDVGIYSVDWLVRPHPTITRAVIITVRADWRYFGAAKSYTLEFVKNAEI
jgi:prepilin-type N-terminal cleavage/methylation domain-containing protein